MNHVIRAFAVLSLLAAGAAGATNYHEPKQPPAPTATASAGSHSAASARSQSASQAVAGSSATGGSATAAGGSVSGVVGGSSAAEQSVTVEGDSVNVPRQAPMALGVLTNTTAECYSTVGFGVSSPVGGISFGTGRKAKDCSRLALAERFYARGQNAAGDRLMCTITEVREALGEDCIALVNTVKLEQPRYVTHEELAERERRKDTAQRGIQK